MYKKFLLASFGRKFYETPVDHVDFDAPYLQFWGVNLSLLKFIPRECPEVSSSANTGTQTRHDNESFHAQKFLLASFGRKFYETPVDHVDFDAPHLQFWGSNLSLLNFGPRECPEVSSSVDTGIQSRHGNELFHVQKVFIGQLWSEIL